MPSTGIRVKSSDPTSDANFGGVNLFNKGTMVDKTVPQCFGMDLERNRIFLFQAKNTPSNKHGGGNYGELAVSLVRPDDGSLVKHMYLKHYHKQASEGGSYGFGHGSQIGLEIDPKGRTLIWVDHKSKVKVPSTRGVQLARVKYSNDATVTADENNVATVEPVPWCRFGEKFNQRFPDTKDITNPSVYFDTVNSVLTVKLFYKGTGFFQVFDVSYNLCYKDDPTVKNMVFNPRVLVKSPPAPKAHVLVNGKATSTLKGLDPNGFAQYGDFLYCMYGRSYNIASDNPSGQNEVLSPTPAQVRAGVRDGNGNLVKKVGSTHIVIFDLTEKDSKGFPLEVDHMITEAGKSLKHREPEGLFIQPTFNADKKLVALELYFCLAGGLSGSRTWSLYKKTRKI